MEKTEHKILKDYNYDQLNEEKMVKVNHIDQIIKNNRENAKLIKEKDQKLKEITKRWDDFIEDVSTANNKIHQSVGKGYTTGICPEEKDVNSMLIEIHTSADYVKQLTFEATNMLQKIGKYPYDTDSDPGESASFSGYSPSPPKSVPGHYIRSRPDDEIMYDSDDLNSMDYLHL